MNEKKDYIGFQKLIKVLAVIFKVAQIVTIVGMVLAAIGAVIVSLIPTEPFQKLLDAQNISTNINLYNMTIYIDSSIIDLHKLKTFIIAAPLVGEVCLALTLYIVTQLRGILQEVAAKTPFSSQSVKRIRFLSYGIMASSVVFQTAQSVLDWLSLRAFNIEKIFMDSHAVTKINFNVFGFDGSILIAGLLILLLANIFQYGAHLQEEYDATL